MKSIYILAGARTPQATWIKGKKGNGSPGGAFKSVDVFDLGAIPVKQALAAGGVSADQVDFLVFGSAYHSHPNNCYGSRYVGLRAGLPESVACLAVNLGCGTSLQAMATAAQLIEHEGAHLVAAGGSESTSNIEVKVLFPSFKDLAAGAFIGETAEAMALAYKISRHEADEWAQRSHIRALVAQKKGVFSEEIAPVGDVREDDHIRADSAMSYFEQAKASYRGGIVTNVNSHGLVDGGAAVILADEKTVKKSGREPLGRYVAWNVVGVPPREMSYASIPAIAGVLKKAGWKLQEVDLFEINETFAAQILVVQRELKISIEKLNVNGGSIALGHPFGATGARLALTLLKELKRRKAKKGVAAVCIGGGQGAAVAVEAA